MSGESTHHIRLVETLERHVRRVHTPPRGLLLLLDHDRYGKDRPHRCGGYCPDLFATDLPTTFEIIGEAKTSSDIERPHSRRQLAGFLEHLSVQKDAYLYVCVPHPTVARARTIIARIRRPEDASVRVEVIAGE